VHAGAGLTLREMGLQYGHGAVVNRGHLLAQHVSISANVGYPLAGGIQNEGTAVIEDSDISSEGVGGGVANQGTLTVRRTSIMGTSPEGGAILNHGELLVEDSRLQGQADFGAALWNDGQAGVFRTWFAFGLAYFRGGAIYNEGHLTVEDFSMEGGFAPRGGLVVNSGEQAVLVLERGTMHGGAAEGRGGAVYADAGHTLLRNVTVVDSSSEGIGSAVYAEAGAKVRISNATIAQSYTSEALAGDGAIELENTILQHNEFGACADPVISLGNNIEDGDTCGLDATGDLPNMDALLGNLELRGAIGRVFRIGPDSPAYDAGSEEMCPDVDQRGVVRPQGAGCEIGAYEVIEPAPVQLFEGWNEVELWPVGDLYDESVTDYLNAALGQSWQSIAESNTDFGYRFAFWRIRFRDPPLEEFNTLNEVIEGRTYWLYMTEERLLEFPALP
jgi:hypothetical protein